MRNEVSKSSKNRANVKVFLGFKIIHLVLLVLHIMPRFLQHLSNNWTACADLLDAAARHIGGLRTQGAMTPNWNSAEIFVQCTYPKFHRPVYSFGSYRVDKQTPLKTSNALRYATTLGNDRREHAMRESTVQCHLHMQRC